MGQTHNPNQLRMVCHVRRHSLDQLNVSSDFRGNTVYIKMKYRIEILELTRGSSLDQIPVLGNVTFMLDSPVYVYQ